MADDDQEELERRQKRTRWLLASGAASLILPLLGLAYLQWTTASSPSSPSGRNDVFERREGGERRITPSQAVPVAPMPSGGRMQIQNTAVESSLDFVKAGSVVEKPQEKTKSAKPAAPEPAKETPKKSKKPFSTPKLQPSRLRKSGATGSPLGGGGTPLDPQIQKLLQNAGQ